MKLCKYTYFICTCWFYSQSETRDIIKPCEISNSHRGKFLKVFIVYFPPQSNEMPSTESEVIKGRKTETEGRRFRYRNLSAYRTIAHRVFIWMVHVCVVVYVILAVRYWKLKGKEVWCPNMEILDLNYTTCKSTFLYLFFN